MLDVCLAVSVCTANFLHQHSERCVRATGIAFPPIERPGGNERSLLHSIRRFDGAQFAHRFVLNTGREDRGGGAPSVCIIAVEVETLDGVRIEDRFKQGAFCGWDGTGS